MASRELSAYRMQAVHALPAAEVEWVQSNLLAKIKWFGASFAGAAGCGFRLST
jgi:hypothetical protein